MEIDKERFVRTMGDAFSFEREYLYRLKDDLEKKGKLKPTIEGSRNFRDKAISLDFDETVTVDKCNAFLCFLNRLKEENDMIRMYFQDILDFLVGMNEPNYEQCITGIDIIFKLSNITRRQFENSYRKAYKDLRYRKGAISVVKEFWKRGYAVGFISGSIKEMVVLSAVKDFNYDPGSVWRFVEGTEFIFENDVYAGMNHMLHHNKERAGMDFIKRETGNLYSHHVAIGDSPGDFHINRLSTNPFIYIGDEELEIPKEFVIKAPEAKDDMMELIEYIDRYEVGIAIYLNP